MLKRKNKRITKAIVPAAGLGTRFYPITKNFPKEMFPIVDKPALQYIIEEAIAAGIKKIYIVISVKKKMIRSYFTFDKRRHYMIYGKHGEIEKLVSLRKKIKIRYIYQFAPLGLGHAIYICRWKVRRNPFAVMLGDDIIAPENSQDDYGLKECTKVFNAKKSSVLGVRRVPLKDANRYGMLKVEQMIEGQPLPVHEVVEKPNQNPPSNYAIMGRYVFLPSIFKYLKQTPLNKKNEMELTDAINQMIKNEKVFATTFSGTRYDIGSKIGLIKAQIEFSLRTEELAADLKKYLKEELPLILEDSEQRSVI